MRNVLRYVLAVVVVAAFGLMLWQGYRLYQQQHTPPLQAMEAIPGDAVMVLKADNILSQWQRFSRNNLVWEELIQHPYFGAVDAWARVADSALAADAELSGWLQGHRLAMASFRSGTDNMDLLLVLELSNDDQAISLSQKASEWFKAASPTTIRGVQVATVQLDGHQWHVYQERNLIVAASSATLSEKSLAALQENSGLGHDSGLTALARTESQNPEVFGRVYLHLGRMDSWLKMTLDKAPKGLIGDAFPLAGWCALDMYSTSNSLMLNGVADPSDGLLHALLDGQQPVEPQFHFAVPSTAQWLLGVALSDRELFLNNLAQRRFSGGREAWAEEIENSGASANTDAEMMMLRWIGTEMVSFALPVQGNPTTLMAFRIDPAQTRPEDLVLQYRVKKDSLNAIDTLRYDGRRAWGVELPMSYARLFGSAFSDSTDVFFTRVDDYLVFAPSRQAMRTYLADLERGRLADQVRFDALLNGKMAAAGNVYAMISPARARDLILGAASADVSMGITNHPGTLDNMEWIALQVGRGNTGQLFMNLLADYNPTERKNSLVSWEVQLDNPALSRPWLIKNHQTMSTDLLVQDMSYRLYLVSASGKVRWHRDLPGAIQGDVMQVDIYNNGKLQMALLCEGKLYLLDILGRDVKNFPASAPEGKRLSVGRYDKENLRFLVATPTGNLMIDQDGKGVSGWGGRDFVPQHAMAYLKVGDKDVIAGINAQGKAVLMSRKGDLLLEAAGPAPMNGSAPITEAGKELNTCRITYLSAGGNIIRMYFGGTMDSIAAAAPEGSKLMMHDMNGDNSNDYLVVSRRSARAWSRDKAQCFSWTFEGEAGPWPFASGFGGLKQYLGLCDAENGEVYLLDASGNELSNGRFRQASWAGVTDLNLDNRLEYTILGTSGILRQFQME
jgi:hypothetical protein